MQATSSILTRGRVAIERAIDQAIDQISSFDLGMGGQPARDGETRGKHDAIESASRNRAFQFLVRLAGELISAGTVSDALTRTLDVAFEALPVHRGLVMLARNGDLRCEIMRIRDHVEHRPKGDVPASEAIIHRVMTERVGLVTNDALADERLGATDSIWQHGIRAAMCVPLWSGQDVIGVLQVDSPLWVDEFSEYDLEFLIAVGNLAAMAVERIHEREMRQNLQRYHSPAMVEELLRKAGSSKANRSLTNADVTVLFADLAGFTALAESMPIDQVADVLSGFCSRVAQAIFAEGGTVDKFIGDCVMAFFGAPVAQVDHAKRGLQAAMRIHTVMTEWNRDRLLAGLPALQVRIGLNSGPVLVGDVGSPERLDYTVIGNTVNVAARLEQQVAEPGDIVFAEATRQQLPPESECEPLGEVSLRGMGRSVIAFRLRPSMIETWALAL